MLSSRSRRMLEDFVSGRSTLREMSNILDDIVADLTETPHWTEEVRPLSGLELLIHELGEGASTRDEIDEYARNLLAKDRAARLSKRCPNPTVG